MALQHVHEKQILHRDLKPQNIFLHKSRKVCSCVVVSVLYPCVQVRLLLWKCPGVDCCILLCLRCGDMFHSMQRWAANLDKDVFKPSFFLCSVIVVCTSAENRRTCTQTNKHARTDL